MPTYTYLSYQTKMQKIADLRYAAAVLQWDQETYLPVAGQTGRGRQLATLEEAAHEAATEPELEKILRRVMELPDLTPEQQRNVALSLEAFERHQKIPASFVRQMSEAIQAAFHAWTAAYRANSFAGFAQPLEKLVQLKRQEADLLGYSGHPYNALMNDYEKGLTTEQVDALFANLLPQLKPIIEVAAKHPASLLFQQHYPKDAQWALGMELLQHIGFDFEAGRQDISLHPFTTNFNARDVRLTTRIDENDLANMVWSCLHEGGHGLYEQGLPDKEYGLPLGEYCSLGIHESQSRLWENNIGRARPFWAFALSKAQAHFPSQLGNIDLDRFYRAMNQVRPSLIRTEADELTYHAHILIRYELEKSLIDGTLKVKDIPEAWADGYRTHLGVDVPNDQQGCLQDVHWSHGSFGYFPTYSLGSLYAAQFYAAMQRQVPDLETALANGNCQPALHWLRTHIHARGKQYLASDLCKKVTGSPLDAQYFVTYAQAKFLNPPA